MSVAPALGVAVSRRFDGPRIVARAGEWVVELALLAELGVLASDPAWRQPSLNAFLAQGATVWRSTGARLAELIDDLHSPTAGSRDRLEPALHHRDDVTMLLPVAVGDFVDFYASEQHATNLGRILRPGQDPLPPAWRHLPIGYHGRSGTIVVSGTPVRRPCGQRRDPSGRPEFGPSRRLDVEVEVGFVVGAGSVQGVPVPVEDFDQHVFGVCLVNDWSARDIQAWETQPLGPFLGKSFATSISPWVVPLSALPAARRPARSAAAGVMPYLRETQPWGLALDLELEVNGEVRARPPYSSMFWSPAQMLAHLTVNGASVRTGDLYASGTVSGDRPDQLGSLIELTGNSAFLADGDEVVIRGTAPGPDGDVIDLGEVRGEIRPALSPGAGRRG
ncbi:MAG TPA: fumarylacetoacetate hydrolase family protein [Mycobacteriales bacterium]|nr:fumarylacetoacetate hydrolase family protein [Mycobacteriales bacterium]